MTSNINAGYSLLRNVAPTFMKVAFADPTLWPRHPNSSGISLAHVFTSPIPDLARFVFMDTIACLAFGVPPLVEYDTSCSVSNIGPIYAQRVEAKHASGATFITTILKISISRAYNHSPPVRHSWEEIEAEIRSWEPQPDECSPDDSWKSVARLAVKEGWRHAGLIYLYMVRSVERVNDVFTDRRRFAGNVWRHEPRSPSPVFDTTDHESAGHYTSGRFLRHTFHLPSPLGKLFDHSLSLLDVYL